ncbi:MAG: MFS transporter, partial [Bacteroidota bacterium]
FNFIDRQLLVILQEPLKAELGLTDTQLGLLTGLAFAALYVVLGIPVARLADTSNRKNIIAISLAFWSVLTTLSGTVKNFSQLFLARIGVGIGEAGCSPPAHALISDYFPPDKRATALSIYSTGIYLGILLGYTIGGMIAQKYGWRYAFYALGIPGILVAILLYFTVREPIKGRLDTESSGTAPLGLKEVIQALLRKKTFVFLALAAGFQAFGNYGIGNFLPSFLQRIHGIDIATAGVVLGLSTGLGGGLGTFLGGYLADHQKHKDERWYIWVPMLAGAVAFLPNAILFFSNNSQLVMITAFFTSALSAFYLGPIIAVSHNLVSAKMWAFTSAILFFVLNFIGLVFGPLVIGMVSDALQPQYGDLSLRWAFTTVFLTGSISLFFLYLGSKNYLKDLKS